MPEDAVARTMISAVEGRVARCEGVCISIADEMRECREREDAHRGRVWSKLSKIEVDLARSSTKVALLVGVVAAVAGAVLSAGLQLWMK